MEYNRSGHTPQCIGVETLTVGATAVGFANIPGVLRAGPVTQSAGSGLNDITPDGSSYNGNIQRDYQAVVDGGDPTNPNTFKWSDDGGTTFLKSGVAMTGAAQTLNHGVTVTFPATTGHTTNDAFDFTTYPKSKALQPLIAKCYLATAQIRIRDDGTDPTSSVGEIKDIAQEFEIIGRANIKNFSAIRTGSTSGVLTVHYFR